MSRKFAARSLLGLLRARVVGVIALHWHRHRTRCMARAWLHGGRQRFASVSESCARALSADRSRACGRRARISRKRVSAHARANPRNRRQLPARTSRAFQLADGVRCESIDNSGELRKKRVMRLIAFLGRPCAGYRVLDIELREAPCIALASRRLHPPSFSFTHHGVS